MPDPAEPVSAYVSGGIGKNVADQTRTCCFERLAWVLLFLFCFSAQGAAALPETAQPTPLRAHVVYANQNRIYIAAQDSLALDPGTILTFLDHQKALATGEVLSVFEGTFLVAKLTSGSLKKVKHQDRLAIAAEPPALRVPSKLRLGYPASGRANLLVACPDLEIDASSLGYQTERISPHEQELIRATGDANTPDTLVIRLFDDAADEEIALERGDLDAGIFWPGEASSHIRDALHWPGHPAGIRDRGILRAPHPLPGDLLSRLNQELFRGDLAPCGTTPIDTSKADPTRFLVDAQIPGQAAMQKFLDRSTQPNPAAATIRIDVTDSLDAGECIYQIRCPILCRPEITRLIEELGADRLVNAIHCSAEGPRR
jgi:hypothetical protein